MRYLRVFIAGLAFPSVLLPCVLLIALIFGKPQIVSVPFLHFIPVIWGVWNILYFSVFITFLPRDLTVRLLITGAVLGFLVALYGVFVARIPWFVGMPASYAYLPLIFVPILYAIFWRFIVHPLNRLLGIRD